MAAGEATGGTTRHRLAVAGWVLAVAATAVNGVLVGYGAVWLQLFGETADAEDYRVSAGGYGAAAVVLALAVVAILTHRSAPRWLAWPTGITAAALALLAVRSLALARSAEQVAEPINGVWDGVGGVVWAPWTWALVALAALGLWKRSRVEGGDTHQPLEAP